MQDGDNLNKAAAMYHVQQAIEAIEATITKSRETGDMLQHLKDARKELAYEIFRA